MYSLNPNTLTNEYRCQNCSVGYAWSDDEWECVQCNTMVPNCVTCTDYTFECVTCANSLIPDFEGKRCSYDLTNSDGNSGTDSGCSGQAFGLDFDSSLGLMRVSCSQSCLAPYVWDPVTWTCTLVPGEPYCISAVYNASAGEYQCTACSDVHFGTTLDNGHCVLDNCDTMNPDNYLECLACSEDPAQFRLYALTYDSKQCVDTCPVGYTPYYNENQPICAKACDAGYFNDPNNFYECTECDSVLNGCDLCSTVWDEDMGYIAQCVTCMEGFNLTPGATCTTCETW